jgi:SAM-dependent methyltransferase
MLISIWKKAIIDDMLFSIASENAGKLVLNVGCGRGFEAYVFVQRSCKVIGVDIRYSVETRYKRCLDFILADAKFMPFKSDMFDSVASFDVIEHIDDDECFVRENSRVVKPGGRVYIGTPNRLRLANRIRQIIFGRMLEEIVFYYEGLGEMHHFREYTIKSSRKLIERHLRIIQTVPIWIGLYLFRFAPGLRRFPNALADFCNYIVIVATKQ